MNENVTIDTTATSSDAARELHGALTELFEASSAYRNAENELAISMATTDLWAAAERVRTAYTKAGLR